MAKKQKQIEISDNTMYRFCGEGQGIPGLPHEVTAAQAKGLGLLEMLQAAIQNGNYASASPTPSPSPFAKTANGEGKTLNPTRPAAETAEKPTSTPHGVETAEGGSTPPRLGKE
jgi:hypothetical protein